MIFLSLEKAFKRTKDHSKKRVLQKLQKIGEFVKSLENSKGEEKFIDDSSIDDVISTLKQYIPKNSFHTSTEKKPKVVNPFREAARKSVKQYRKKLLFAYKKEKVKSNRHHVQQKAAVTSFRSKLDQPSHQGWNDLIEKLQENIKNEKSGIEADYEKKEHYQTQLEKIKEEINSLKKDYAENENNEPLISVGTNDNYSFSVKERLKNKPTTKILHITPVPSINFNLVNADNSDTASGSGTMERRKSNKKVVQKLERNGLVHDLVSSEDTHNKDGADLISIRIGETDSQSNTKRLEGKKKTKKLETTVTEDSLQSIKRREQNLESTLKSKLHKPTMSAVGISFSTDSYPADSRKSTKEDNNYLEITKNNKIKLGNKVINTKTVDEILSNMEVNDKYKPSIREMAESSGKEKTEYENDPHENLDNVGTSLRETDNSHIVLLNPSILDENSVLQLNATELEGQTVKELPNDNVINIKMASNSYSKDKSESDTSPVAIQMLDRIPDFTEERHPKDSHGIATTETNAKVSVDNFATQQIFKQHPNFSSINMNLLEDSHAMNTLVASKMKKTGLRHMDENLPEQDQTLLSISNSPVSTEKSAASKETYINQYQKENKDLNNHHTKDKLVASVQNDALEIKNDLVGKEPTSTISRAQKVRFTSTDKAPFNAREGHASLIENEKANVGDLSGKSSNFIKVDQNNLQKVIEDAFAGRFHYTQTNKDSYRINNNDGEALKAELQKSIEKALSKNNLKDVPNNNIAVPAASKPLYPELQSRARLTTPTILVKTFAFNVPEDNNKNKKKSPDFETELDSLHVTEGDGFRPTVWLRENAVAKDLPGNTHKEHKPIAEEKLSVDNSLLTNKRAKKLGNEKSARNDNIIDVRVPQNQVSNFFAPNKASKLVSVDTESNNEKNNFRFVEDPFLVSKINFESTLNVPPTDYASDSDKIR